MSSHSPLPWPPDSSLRRISGAAPRHSRCRDRRGHGRRGPSFRGAPRYLAGVGVGGLRFRSSRLSAFYRARCLFWVRDRDGLGPAAASPALHPPPSPTLTLLFLRRLVRGCVALRPAPVLPSRLPPPPTSCPPPPGFLLFFLFPPETSAPRAFAFLSLLLRRPGSDRVQEPCRRRGGGGRGGREGGREAGWAEPIALGHVFKAHLVQSELSVAAVAQNGQDRFHLCQ